MAAIVIVMPRISINVLILDQSLEQWKF